LGNESVLVRAVVYYHNDVSLQPKKFERLRYANKISRVAIVIPSSRVRWRDQNT
jgi:hypothetical protein